MLKSEVFYWQIVKGQSWAGTLRRYLDNSEDIMYNIFGSNLFAKSIWLENVETRIGVKVNLAILPGRNRRFPNRLRKQWRGLEWSYD